MNNKIKVVSIVRVSTEEQSSEKHASLENQKNAINFCAEKYNLEVVQSIELINVSGTAISGTPEIKNMLQMIYSHQISGIVLYHLDRLMRLDNYRELGLLQDLKENDILIYTPDNVVDLNSESGHLSGAMTAVMGGYELSRIKRRMIASKEIKRQAGKCPTSDITLPSGISYDRDSDKFYYNDESVKIKRIFDIYDIDKIQNLSEICRIIGEYTPTGIKKILQNPIYTGRRYLDEKRGNEKYFRADGRQPDRKKIKRKPEEIIDIQVIDEPLIPIDQFERIQKSLKSKRTRYKSRPARFKYQGKLVCGCCGENVYTSSRRDDPNRDYYLCRKKKENRQNDKCNSVHHRRDIVDNTIDVLIQNKLVSSEFIKKIIRYIKSNNSVENENLKMIASERKFLNACEKKKLRLLDVYSDGTITKDDFEKKINPIYKDIALSKSKITDLELNIQINKTNITESVLNTLQYALFDYPFWIDEQRKSFVNKNIESITIDKNGAISSINLFVANNQTHKGRGSLLLSA